MVENAPRPGMPDAGLLFVAQALSAPGPLVHGAHGWMVDVATHGISKRRCPACEAESDQILAEVAAAQLADALTKAGSPADGLNPKARHAPAA